MRLAPRVLVPLLYAFVTMRSVDVDHCEYDEAVVFIIAAVIMYFTGQNIYAYFGSTLMTATFVALSIISMSGIGDDDFQLAVKIILMAMLLATSYQSVIQEGATTMEVLGFSVQLTSSSFDIISEIDLKKRQDKLDEKKEELEKLEEELDLSGEQDRITNYIYDLQYDGMYDMMYEQMYENF
ncbi:MAG: hypothetical protein CSA86_01785 [Arcobacter sp.]|nr:MAG: hypothetical protein CSA86_01785 [Arcobacter sp.]